MKIFETTDFEIENFTEHKTKIFRDYNNYVNSLKVEFEYNESSFIKLYFFQAIVANRTDKITWNK